MALVSLSTLRPGIRLIELTDAPRYNALSADMVTALKGAFSEVAEERETRVVILAGEGKGFCAGADLSHSGSPAPGSEGRNKVGWIHRAQEHLAELMLQIHELKQPVIAAVHGAAVGGGLALALAADVRVASTDAFFSAHFVKVGLSSCDVGTSYLLPRIVGAGRSMELMLTGRRCKAEEAERIGLITKVVPPDQVRDAAIETAEMIASLSDYSVYFTKLGGWANIDAPSLRHAMELENRTQVLGTFVGNMTIAAEAFIAKTDPEWLPM